VVKSGRTAAAVQTVWQRAATPCRCVHATATRAATVHPTAQYGTTTCASPPNGAGVRYCHLSWRLKRVWRIHVRHTSVRLMHIEHSVGYSKISSLRFNTVYSYYSSVLTVMELEVRSSSRW